jgi:hypothetical protein
VDERVHVSSLKGRVRSVIDAVGTRIAAEQVRRFRRSHPGPIVVLDLDNTMADAWPSFLAPPTSHRDRLAGLSALPGMVAAAFDGDRPVIFLSHRAWWHWDVTRRWVRDHGMAGPVVLVASPADKLEHLRCLVAGGGPVTYWDDLSHGTERGRTELYHDVIQAVAGLGLDYHGYDEIEAIVAAAGGRPSSPD